MSEWETFCDVCYYDLWRVRRTNERGFHDGFHLQHGKEAKELVELLNKLERERDEARDMVEKFSEQGLDLMDANRTLKRERDEAREKIKRQTDRIRTLEGATNHACGTPLSIAIRERDEARAIIQEAKTKFCCDGSDGEIAAAMFHILCKFSSISSSVSSVSSVVKP